MPNISTDPIVPSDPASVRLNPFKYIALLIGLYGAYTQIAKRYGSKKGDANFPELEDSRSNFHFQLPTSLLLATLVASSTWFFEFSGIAAIFAFAAVTVSVEIFRSMRSWAANKFFREEQLIFDAAQDQDKPLVNEMVRKIFQGISLSKSEVELYAKYDSEEKSYSPEKLEMQKIGKEDAGSWLKYLEHFFDRRTWLILGSPQQIRNYYVGWALHAQKNSARISEKAEGKEEEKFSSNNHNTPFDVSMLADGKMIEDDLFAEFALLMGVRVEFSTSLLASVNVTSRLSNGAMHCLIHFILHDKNNDWLESMLKSNPVYIYMLDEFYSYYDLEKSEDQNKNVDNFIALKNTYSHPWDREIIFGQFFRAFFRNIKQLNKFSELNTYVRKEGSSSEQELNLLQLHRYDYLYDFTYGRQELNLAHNEKLKVKNELFDIVRIPGTDDQANYLKNVIQAKYNKIRIATPSP